MDILENKHDSELQASMLAEAAKARNELACARRDLDKANSRLSFLIVVINELLNRKKD